MSAIADRLKSIPLFSSLEQKEIDHIAALMIARRFKVGDKLTEQGSTGVGFFVIDEGTAEITVDGDPKGSVGAGDYFGEVALLSSAHSTRTATITATTDMVVFAMTAWDFKPLVEAHGDIAAKLLAAMAKYVD